MQKNLSTDPYHILFRDEKNIYTVSDVNRISGQVYNYLKTNGIGREDVVMINMPRCAEVLCVFFGILKAGACAVIVDADAEEKYIHFFTSDTNPSIIINNDILKSILSLSALHGWEEPDEHDAAFIVYTSSSTGMPKGCIHEYGDIELLRQKKEAEKEKGHNYSAERVALAAALYDISAIMTAITSLYENSFIYVVDRDVCRSVKAYVDVIRTNNLNIAALMPHMTDLKLLSEIPGFAIIYTGFDIIENVFIPGYPLYNCYGLSESIIDISYFLIEKDYDITPVGKPNPFRKAVLLDENDLEVQQGEIGEVAFPNPFFRGYVNKPELSAYVKRNGIYHTGDMGYFDNNRDLVILGRKNDILKTSKGFIVPAFTKAELKKLYHGHVELTASRINGRDCLCVFYIENEASGIDFGQINSRLAEKLPPRQLPTHYIPLKEFQQLKSGKLNRAVLREMLNNFIEGKNICG